jgi:hypothetical protein
MRAHFPIGLMLVFCGCAVAAEEGPPQQPPNTGDDPVTALVHERDAAQARLWWKAVREIWLKDPAKLQAALQSSSTLPPVAVESSELAEAAPAPNTTGSVESVAKGPANGTTRASAGTAAQSPMRFAALQPPSQDLTADRHVRAGSAVQIDASAGATTGTIVLSTPGTPFVNDDSTTIRSKQWSVTASSAVDTKSNGSATFASLNGPANGASLGFDYTYTEAAIVTDQHVRDYEELCALSGYGDFDCVADNFDKHGPKDPSKQAEYDAALARYNSVSSTGLVLNMHGGLNHNEFSYYDVPSTKHTIDKTGWKLGGEIGMTTHARTSYFGVGFDFVHAYKEDKDRVVCPASDAATFDCISGKFSAPKNQVGRQIYLDASSWEFAKAFSVRLSHDFATDDNAVDVPVYLFGSKDAPFTGGVRLGWTTDDHFLAGIFVGKPFQLTGASP